MWAKRASSYVRGGTDMTLRGMCMIFEPAEDTVLAVLSL